MPRTAEFLAGLAVIVGLSVVGTVSAELLDLPVPGPIVGLLLYIGVLRTGMVPGSVVAARWLSGLLGGLIVPPLVGVAGFAPILASGGWRLAVALVAGVLVTGLVTAATFRLIAR